MARAEVAYEAQRRTFYEQQLMVLAGTPPLVFANHGRGSCRYLVVVSR